MLYAWYVLRYALTQIRYASLLATKWLIERLGNRSSAGRQQTGRPSRRRRKRGRANPVPASDHRKKGICRPLTVQCKYLVCFMHFLITFCPPCILQLRMCQGGQGPYKNLCNTEPKLRNKVFLLRILC